MSCIKNLEYKLDSLLKEYKNNCAELELLRNEINVLQTHLQQKDLQISALYEEIGNRDRIIQSLKTTKKSKTSTTKTSLKSNNKSSTKKLTNARI